MGLGFCLECFHLIVVCAGTFNVVVDECLLPKVFGVLAIWSIYECHDDYNDEDYDEEEDYATTPSGKYWESSFDRRLWVAVLVRQEGAPSRQGLSDDCTCLIADLWGWYTLTPQARVLGPLPASVGAKHPP